MAKRILLGIDFIGVNFPAALYTVQQWWNYLNSCAEYMCTVGISNSCERSAFLRGASSLSPTDALWIFTSFIPKDQLVQWTSDIDAALIDIVKANDCQSKPFYSGFNYGTVNNRLLLLAYSHDCDYLIRVDPGTLPPNDKEDSFTFAQLMKVHEDIIGNNRRNIVSRQYAKRVALRHMFVKSSAESSHRDLVTEFTGIDVRSQVTGGAMLTFRSPGVPAVCFPTGSGGTLVWASDDGIYQVLHASEARGLAIKESPIERFDAVGKPKKSPEYYRGIIGAVCLKAMREGKTEDEAEQVVKAFFEKLKNDILSRDKCIKIDENPNWESTFCLDKIAPRPFIEAIATGCNNHKVLLREWEKICDLLKPSIIRETNANKLLQEKPLMDRR